MKETISTNILYIVQPASYLCSDRIYEASYWQLLCSLNRKFKGYFERKNQNFNFNETHEMIYIDTNNKPGNFYFLKNSIHFCKQFVSLHKYLKWSCSDCSFNPFISCNNQTNTMQRQLMVYFRNWEKIPPIRDQLNKLQHIHIMKYSSDIRALFPNL